MKNNNPEINVRRLTNGRFAFKTDIGRIRLSNEDQARVLINNNGDILMVIADGMGGHNKGDFASKMAVDFLCDEFEKVEHFRLPILAKLWLGFIARKINKAIFKEAQASPIYNNMGTTLCVVLLYKDSIVTLNVGDSRAYYVGADSMVHITQDQSYVDYLYRSGKITIDEAKVHPRKNVLLNALGIYPSLNYAIEMNKYNGDSILVCSDGLYNNISEKEMHAILTTNDRVEQKVQSLIDVANHNGGSDNIGIAYFERNK